MNRIGLFFRVASMTTLVTTTVRAGYDEPVQVVTSDVQARIATDVVVVRLISYHRDR